MLDSHTETLLGLGLEKVNSASISICSGGWVVMTRSWNVLVVDDEADIHDVTDLALKRRSYRGRRFRLLHASSAAEARAVLTTPEGPALHVALVDVLMETDTAGLELCEHIRKELPDSLRIILRTGQAGAAPEEAVMNDYDIDAYLSKANVTDEVLYAALRAACRSSVDIATANAVANQLRAYIEALQASTTGMPELRQIMYDALDFLEAKHDVQLALVESEEHVPRHGVDLARIRGAITEATGKGSGPVIGGGEYGLSRNELLFLIEALQIAPEVPPTSPPSMLDRVARWLQKPRHSPNFEPVTAAIYARLAEGVEVRVKEGTDLVHDLNRFMAGWRVAMAMLSLRDRIVNERVVAGRWL